ncbi:ABC transporter ATP-binding protein [Marinomonas sp. CT5]|jgi:branched-chain amino acid transport system ATP-binding protein|uniref:ABC transporter related n=1 Tax=Marinomonas sp. (strain MWYL1) TaxID=400668 RepID=A6W087_MARMS|nr:ABC transporter ATP-binding protein [Marinomonas sp. CT5]MBU0801291.1 ABC transporter ATP-binding protein [Alphaproteobacteria bacterium]QUX96529.1 ABC transporter ATP-binding protein [Marinomonas sp. CT5]
MSKLVINNLHSYYGKSHILNGIELAIESGEIVTLLGRNGAGKTTTLKTIVGVVKAQEGSVQLNGENLVGKEIFEIARKGISLVPEHRGIFGILSVEENLRIAIDTNSPWSLEDIYKMFPRLKERRKNGGNALSGGEQQMLAIARALVNNPNFLLLDEPTEGLAPVIVDEIVRILDQIRAAGVGVLLVEQNLSVCEKLADKHYVVELGEIVYQGSKAEFSKQDDIKSRYLAV